MGRQYYGEANSLNDKTYRVELHNSFVANNHELKIGVPSFEWTGVSKRAWENPLMDSRCSCVFTALDGNAYQNIVNIGLDEEQQWAMVVYKDDVLFWVGRVVADQITYKREAIGTGFAQLEVTATCGLKQLDGFSMEDITFTIGDRQIVCEIILQILKKINTYTFWGATDNFLQDGILYENAETDAGAGTLDGTLRSCAFYRNFDQLKPGDVPEWKNCKEGLESILTAFGAQILLSNGLWVIRQLPAHDDASYPVNYYQYGGNNNAYGTAFNHQITVVDTNSIRPKFEVDPIYSNQWPVSSFEVQFDRRNGATGSKTTSNTTAVTAEHNDIRNGGSLPGYVVRVDFQISFNYYGPDWNKYDVLYQIWAETPGGSKYEYYNGAWVAAASIPNKLLRIDEPDWKAGMHNFNYSFQFVEPPSGASEIHVSLLLRRSKGKVIILPTGQKVVVWTSPTTSLYDFTGSILIRQAYNNAEPYYFSTQANFIDTLDAPRDTNSKKEVIKIDFYNGRTNEVGSYLAWDGAAYVEAGAWSAPWTATTGDLPELLCNQWVGVYADFLPIISGTLHDAGTYRADMTLLMDSVIWFFNGGTFNAYDDSWNAEWLGVQVIYTNVTTQGEGQRVLNEDDRTQDKLETFQLEISRLRQTMGNVAEKVIEDMTNSTGFPSSDPGSNRTFSIELGYEYDASAPTLSWVVQEKKEIVKTSNETISSDSTLSNDSQLKFEMEASKTYYIDIMVFYTTSAIGLFKYATTGPGTPGIVQTQRAHGGSNPVTGLDTSYTASTNISAVTAGFVQMRTVVQTGAVGGTFAFQWAQAVSDGTQTTVMAGSYLKYIKV